jgi:lipopolysaccharide transport system ATP-binding protein
MSDIVIRAENLGKKYRIQHQQEQPRYVALRDVLADKMLAPWRWLGAQRSNGNGHNRNPQSAIRNPQSAEDFWALKDVSFEVKQGEVVGIIGRNGAGKSTLLKILSRITEPTEGRVRIRGRVASLLEVGTGFHPELTGRENIFLNGAILGMTKAEIRKKFDEIVAFAEIEKFLDTPVKRYSSGMFVRLAFAVAAHLEPEILVVDEVLAVGDAEFQKKCLGKMESAARGEGRTVFFVSHNMAAIESLCSSAALLVGGRLEAKGDTKKIVRDYLSDLSHDVVIPLKERRDRQGSGVVRFTSVSFADGSGRSLTTFQCGAEAMLVLEFENTSDRELSKLRVALGVDNELGQRVLPLDSMMLGMDLEKVIPGVGVVKVVMPRLCLLPGRYHFSIFSTVNGVIADWIMNAGFFDVEGGDYFGTGQLPSDGEGLFVMNHAFRYEEAT